MNKDSTRCGAAGLRRSAIVERLRLREEWSALKEIPNETERRQKPSTKARKQNTVYKSHKNTAANKVISRSDRSKEVNEILRGIVVLVEVGSETRALPLRAALSALGASVVPAWSPLVTHLVWTQGGCRGTRAKARVLGCSLVSPLWVEACAAEGRKLPERIFPAPTRPSDLPSPATLRKFLKKAERENIPLQNLLSDSPEEKRPPLRLSSDTSRDTSHDTSRDTSKDTSHDATDIETRVNTAPRRKPQEPVANRKPVKSKRKLFTQKEPELQTTDEESENETMAGPKRMQPSKMTQRDRKDLAKAERMARLLMGTCKTTQTNKPTVGTQHNKQPKIVLTGMSRMERHEAWLAIKQLNGKVQQHVDRKTTHVVMGSFHTEDIPTTATKSPTAPRQSPKTPRQSPKTARQSPKTPRQSPKTARQSPKTPRQSPKTARQSPRQSKNSEIPLTMCNKCNSPGQILSKMFSTNVTVEDYSKKNKNDRHVICHCDCDISGVKTISDVSDNNLIFPVELRCDNNNRINLNSNERTQNNDIIRECSQSFDIFGSNRENGQRDILGRVSENEQNNDIFGSNPENGQDIEDLGPEREITPSNDNNLGTIPENRQVNMENVVNSKPRTVNALLGAACGCRVLRLEWIRDSLRANRWLHHIGYEVRHLKKISQKARVERSALNKMHTEYAYNVFHGMRVRISPDADQKDAITQLLTLCGAVIQNGDQPDVENTQNNPKSGKNGAKITFTSLIARIQNQNGSKKEITQNGRRIGAQIQDGAGTLTADFDLTVGKGKGEVSSKWVFDSVAAARMRTTRRYLNSDF